MGHPHPENQGFLRIRRRLPWDALPVAATGLLLMMAAGRASVRLLAPEPVRVRDVFRADSTRFPRGRLVVVAADSADGLRSRDVARSASPDLPLELRVVGSDDDSRHQQMRRLVRAYGFEHLPVLLTLDAEARVMRVQQL